VISANSRYAASTVISVDKDGQPVNVITPGQQQPQTISYVSHMVTDLDRLDNLSNQYYGDPTAWWIIANANPEIIDWTNLTPGAIIRVPFQ
jgi:nucleoid-associated protein YgaU